MSDLGLLEEVVESIDFGEIECQFNHDNGAVPDACRTCTVEVTHIGLATCARRDVLLCESGANAMRAFIKDPDAYCKSCHKRTREHWTVRPI